MATSEIMAVKAWAASVKPVTSIVPVKFVPSQTKPTGEVAATASTSMATVCPFSEHVPDTVNVAELLAVLI